MIWHTLSQIRLRTAIPIEELRLSVLPAEGACGDDSFRNLSPKSSKKVQQRTWRMHFYDVRSRDVRRCGRVGCPDFFSETPLRTWWWASRGEKLAPSPAVSDWILWMIGCANRVSTNAPISASIALSCRAAALLHQHTLDPPTPTLTSSRLQFASKFNTEMASVMRTSSARPCIHGALGKYNECIEAMEIGGSCRSGRWGFPADQWRVSGVYLSEENEYHSEIYTLQIVENVRFIFAKSLDLTS